MPDTRARTEWTEWDSNDIGVRCACGKLLDFSAAIFSPEVDAFDSEGHTVKIPPRWSMICPLCFRGHFKNAITESSYDSGWVKPHTTIITENKMPLNYGGFRMPGEKQPWTIFELRAFVWGIVIGFAGCVAIGLAALIFLHPHPQVKKLTCISPEGSTITLYFQKSGTRCEDIDDTTGAKWSTPR